jgi:LPXTG-motif cell wall-anchored protein
MPAREEDFMNFRGIARAVAAATLTAAFIGGLGTPAHAQPDLPGFFLANVPVGGIFAANPIPTTTPAPGTVNPFKDCVLIDDGVAVPDKDGWLFSMPPGEFSGLAYLLAFSAPGNGGGVHVLALTAKGVFTAPDNKLAASADLNADLQPAPPGVTGKLTVQFGNGGGWVKTPKGWGLTGGVVFVEGGSGNTFDLLRICPALAPTTPAAHPSTSGASLPVTGDNTGTMVGVGAGLVAAGVVLFVAYRRRRGVKFVA